MQENKENLFLEALKNNYGMLSCESKLYNKMTFWRHERKFQMESISLSLSFTEHGICWLQQKRSHHQCKHQFQCRFQWRHQKQILVGRASSFWQSGLVLVQNDLNFPICAYISWVRKLISWYLDWLHSFYNRYMGLTVVVVWKHAFGWWLHQCIIWSWGVRAQHSHLSSHIFCYTIILISFFFFFFNE